MYIPFCLFVPIYILPEENMGFPGDSDGKEAICNVGDLGSIPSWEDPLQEGMATYSSIPAWRIPVDRGTWRATVHMLQRVGQD